MQKALYTFYALNPHTFDSSSTCFCTCKTYFCAIVHMWNAIMHTSTNISGVQNLAVFFLLHYLLNMESQIDCFSHSIAANLTCSSMENKIAIITQHPAINITITGVHKFTGDSISPSTGLQFSQHITHFAPVIYC